MKVIVCDDSIIVRQLIGKYVEKMGHFPIYAENGEQAVAIFKKELPDLVIIDVEMPGMDGYQATRELRQACDEFSQWIPIIFLSSNIDDESIVKGIDAGGDDYLAKPVSLAVLKAKIHAMGRLASMRQKLIEFSNQLHEVNEKLLSSNQILSELSLKDPLTRLGNRRSFEEALLKICRGAIRDKESICMMMVDVDNFKFYNDTYGHQAGDNCLQQVGQVLKQSLRRPGDFVARFGGEEFAVLLPNTDLNGGLHVAERMRSKVQALQLLNENAPYRIVTISVGVSYHDAKNAFDTKALIRAADEALYSAKEKGRNCVKYNNMTQEETKTRASLVDKNQPPIPPPHSTSTH